MKSTKGLEQVKCPHCGYMNIKLTKKCTKCRYDLDVDNKSCPKCGRINANSVKKCECGFNFNRKRRTLLGNFIITLIVMILLFILYKFFGDFADKFSVALKAIFVFGAFVMVIKTFTNIKDEEVTYGAEQEMFEKHKPIIKMKAISNISIIIGFVVIVAFLIYYYIFR